MCSWDAWWNSIMNRFLFMRKINLLLFILLTATCMYAQPMGNPAVFQRPSYTCADERKISLDSIFVQTSESIDVSCLNNAILLNFCTSTHDFFEVSSADKSCTWLINSDGSVIASGAKLQYYDKVVVVTLSSGVYQVVNYKGQPFRHDLNLARESGAWFDDVRYITGSKGPYLVLKPYKSSRYMLVTPDFRRIGDWYNTVGDAQAVWEQEEGR